ncbi:XrtA/PEP-CTERM system-associated ATPase [Thalassotalea maritima]|uniref:XrtA/PEP-CTERM system-associated ATPase n=1 Tax=Thalassotalea maritima TaxID=3242416 RepID=UPI0035280B45
MYEKFYQLTEKPFQLSPDPKFFFGSKEHSQAMAYLKYGLQQGEGFIVITGHIGTGKTMLARSILADINSEDIIAIQIVSSNLSPLDLLIIIAEQFHLSVDKSNKAGILHAIESFLLKLHSVGKRALLLVDEAQNLPMETIEELRMLSNFQQDNKPLLQSFLLGQVELKQQLQHPNMEQFRQRIIASYHLKPLTMDELEEYIHHRLNRAGGAQERLISDDCLPVLHHKSGGIPRKVNLLMDRVLLYGYLNDIKLFKATDIENVLNEFALELGPLTNDNATLPANDNTILPTQLLEDANSINISLKDIDEYLQLNINKKLKLNRYLDKVIEQKRHLKNT